MPFLDMLTNLNPGSFMSGIAPLNPTASSPSRAKGEYVKKVLGWRDLVIDNYYKGRDVNQSIAEIVEKNKLNQDQTNRIIEEVNQELYNKEYDKVKGQTVRDVRFTLASKTKIKDLLNPMDSKKLENTDKNIEGGAGANMKDKDKHMSKVASFFEEDLPSDKLDCFNYSPYECALLATESDRKITSKDMKIKKIAKEVETLDKEIEKTANDLCDMYGDLAKKFVDIGRYNGANNVQPIFREMCKKACFDLGKQRATIDMFNNKVNNFKELGYIAKIANFTLEEVKDYKEEHEDFSLGKYAFDQPNVIKPTKSMINNMNDLVALANKIEKQQDRLAEKQQKRTKVDAGNIEK